jgi:competence protein ComEC
VRCSAGQRWQWDGVEFSMLWPDAGPLMGSPNDHCCVLRVRAVESGIAALLAADIEAPVERVLLARDRAALAAQILLVPHHGSKTSSTEPFLDSIGPLIAVFQVGYRNRFHHPNPGVFERYLGRHIELARSDEDGAVQIQAGAEAAPDASSRNAAATLTLDRYRTSHHRYWMDP